MATPSLPRNADRTFRQCMKIMRITTSVDNVGVLCSKPVGGCTQIEIKKHIWQSEGTPSGGAVVGMRNGDWILDVSNSIVYNCTAPYTGTYVAISARA